MLYVSNQGILGRKKAPTLVNMWTIFATDS